MTTRLTDERLEAIRERQRDIILLPQDIAPSMMQTLRDWAIDLKDLLAEVERQRRSESQSSYQLCPLCHGQQHVAIPPWHPGDQPYFTSSGGTEPQLYACKICAGAGVIERPKAKEER
jgi:hypothetical protein